MNNTMTFWRDMYKNALSELDGAMNRFDQADPNDVAAIDATIYSITSAEQHIASVLRQLKQVQEESLCAV